MIRPLAVAEPVQEGFHPRVAYCIDRWQSDATISLLFLDGLVKCSVIFFSRNFSYSLIRIASFCYSTTTSSSYVTQLDGRYHWIKQIRKPEATMDQLEKVSEC